MFLGNMIISSDVFVTRQINKTLPFYYPDYLAFLNSETVYIWAADRFRLS